MPSDVHEPAPSSPPPKVSVAMFTYNHAKFIAQAIESVLMQETSFPIELVVGEDCSTDGTLAIVQKYAQTHPSIVRPLFHARNVGAGANFEAVLAACRGEYIAFLEGDDYWTSPQKLQKQVRMLDSHPEAAICFHKTQVVFDDDFKSSYLSNKNQPTVTSIHDVLKGWYIMTCSMCFRRSFLPELPSWINQLDGGDWVTQMLLATRGNIYYIDELLGVYRKHSHSISASYTPGSRAVSAIRLYRHFDEWSRHRYHSIICRQLSLAYCRSAMWHRSVGEYLHFLTDAIKCFRYMRYLSLLDTTRSLRELVLSKKLNLWLSRTRLWRMSRYWIVKQVAKTG
jgi:glycosyltransferase involved in cell wall biosynthesis